jgi:uncharacterized RmlC-like cupin family protein
MTALTREAFDYRRMMSEVAELHRKPTCRVVRAGAEFVSKQGHLLAPGISAQSVGARRIHLQIATIPPSARANAHKHADHETALYPEYGTVRSSNSISSRAPGTFSTSPPICRICLTI